MFKRRKSNNHVPLMLFLIPDTEPAKQWAERMASSLGRRANIITDTNVDAKTLQDAVLSSEMVVADSAMLAPFGTDQDWCAQVAKNAQPLIIVSPVAGRAEAMIDQFSYPKSFSKDNGKSMNTYGEELVTKDTIRSTGGSLKALRVAEIVADLANDPALLQKAPAHARVVTRLTSRGSAAARR